MTRQRKKVLDKLARSQVSKVMQTEYLDMIEANRPRTQERLEWLENHGANQAVVLYKQSTQVTTGLDFFAEKCKFYAKAYIQHVVLPYEQGITNE